MDYKYIEQLIERYFACQTTVDEERILRTFFSGGDVPTQLQQYQDLFHAQHLQSQVCLSQEACQRLTQRFEQPVVRALRISLAHRLRPLFHAAAVVAIILTLGLAAQTAVTTSDSAAPAPATAAADSLTPLPATIRTDAGAVSQISTDSLRGTHLPITHP